MINKPQEKPVEISGPVKSLSKPKPLQMYQTLVAACIATCTAEAITMPLDTIKVRMQLFPGTYKNLLDCGRQIFVNEGIPAFYQGLQAGVMRHAILGTIRMGLFNNGQQYLCDTKGEDQITLYDRICLGMGSGAIAQCIANPTDVVKVRFQAEVRNADSSKPARYRNVFHAFKKIFQEEGMRGFYQSLVPNVLRVSVMNSIEVGFYSQIKYMFTIGKGDFGMFDDGMKLVLFASSITGLLSIIVASPLDVIKTKVMDGKIVEGKKIPYSSILECIKITNAENGISGFYKGFNANCQRNIGWNVSMFVLLEQILTYFRERN